MNKFIKPNHARIKLSIVFIILFFLGLILYSNYLDCNLNIKKNSGLYSIPVIVEKYPHNYWLNLWDSIISPCPPQQTSAQTTNINLIRIAIIVFLIFCIYLISCLIDIFYIKKLSKASLPKK